MRIKTITTAVMFATILSLVLLLSGCIANRYDNDQNDTFKEAHIPEATLATSPNNEETQTHIPNNDEAEENNPSIASLPPMDVSVGEIITFGNYSWLVLDVEDGRALLLSEEIIGLRPFHNSDEYVNWEASDIRRFLNEEFLNQFGEDERVRIAETENINNVSPWFYDTDTSLYD